MDYDDYDDDYDMDEAYDAHLNELAMYGLKPGDEDMLDEIHRQQDEMDAQLGPRGLGQGPPSPAAPPLARFPNKMATVGDMIDHQAALLFGSSNFQEWVRAQAGKPFFKPEVKLMGPSEKRVNKRWVPSPGDVVCVACKDRAKVPSYYQESSHWILCRECAEKAGLRYYMPGGLCEQRYGQLMYPVSRACQDTQYPEYVGGEKACGACASDKLLVLYDSVEDEWLVCGACQVWRQQVRIWNKYSSEMKDSIQPPQVMDRVAQRWR